jgi:hypothetical protein
LLSAAAVAAAACCLAGCCRACMHPSREGVPHRVIIFFFFFTAAAADAAADGIAQTLVLAASTCKPLALRVVSKTSTHVITLSQSLTQSHGSHYHTEGRQADPEKVVDAKPACDSTRAITCFCGGQYATHSSLPGGSLCVGAPSQPCRRGTCHSSV